MSIKSRLLPIQIKHTLPNLGLVDFRKEFLEKGGRITLLRVHSMIILKGSDYWQKASLVWLFIF